MERENNMNTTQTKFLELAKYYEELKDKLEEVRVELQANMTELGIGTNFQDPDTLTVYKIVKPKGVYMYFRDIEYVRTAQEGEKSGTLAKTEAALLGYFLKR